MIKRGVIAVCDCGKDRNMFELILVLMIGWVLWGCIKLAVMASWGLLKMLGIVLSVIAFPILFIGVLVVGVGAYLLLPLLLVGAAFGCLVKA